MGHFRKFMSWVFAFTSLSCIMTAIGLDLRAIHRYHTLIPLRIQMLITLFMAFAFIYGVSWWVVWKGKPASRRCGIASSIIYIMFPLFEIIRFSRSFCGYRSVVIIFGIIGLVVFSSDYVRLARESKTNVNDRIQSDGFSYFVKCIFIVFIGIMSIGAYAWWVHWCKEKGIHETDNIAHRDLLMILAIVPVFTIITASRELGYAATSLVLGMRLRTVIIGPLQWRVRDDKWQFQFKPREVFAAEDGLVADPTTDNLLRLRYICIILSGMLATVLSGLFALWIAFISRADSPAQAGGLLAFFGVFSLVISAFNLIPAGNMIYKNLSGRVSQV